MTRLGLTLSRAERRGLCGRVRWPWGRRLRWSRRRGLGRLGRRNVRGAGRRLRLHNRRRIVLPHRAKDAQREAQEAGQYLTLPHGAR